MAITIFTTGSPTYSKSADGADVVHIDFDSDVSNAYQRLELPDGARLETAGAVAESFGRGGAVLEVVDLPELGRRYTDFKMVSEVGGSCRLTRDEQSLIFCDRGSCEGSCTLKSFLLFSWCSCG